MQTKKTRRSELSEDAPGGFAADSFGITGGNVNEEKSALTRINDFRNTSCRNARFMGDL
jgi:hypothetical protein